MDYTIKKVFMTNLEDLLNENSTLELKPEIKELLMQAADALKGPDRRLLMAETVRSLGKGGQRKAERERERERERESLAGIGIPSARGQWN